MIILDDNCDLNFTCEYCNQHFSHFTVNIAVLFYGVAFLERNNKGYACITCPSCLNTLLLQCNWMQKLYKALSVVELPDNSMMTDVALGYYSSIIYYPKQIKQLEKFDITFWNSWLSEFEKETFKDRLNTFLDEEKRNSPIESLCSYLPENDLPMGSFASLWFFRSDNVEELLEIENKERVRVFPRYYYKTDFFETIDSFCWEYVLGHEHHRELLEQNRDSENQLMELAEQNNLDINQLIEENPGIISSGIANLLEQSLEPTESKLIFAGNKFLEILLEDAGPLKFNYTENLKNAWKTRFPLRYKSLPLLPLDFNIQQFENPDQNKKYTDLVSAIKTNYNKQYVLDYLSKNYINFINEYIGIAGQKDFSYGAVWQIKLKYLESLQAVIQKGIREDAPYAFYKKGDMWVIKYEGKMLYFSDSVGFKYVHYLVSRKNIEISTTDLALLDGCANDTKKYCEDAVYVADEQEDESISHNASDPVAGDNISSNAIADLTFLKQYRDDFMENNSELEKAQNNNDLASVEKLKREQHFFLQELLKIIPKKDLHYFHKGEFEKIRIRHFKDDKDKTRGKIVQAINRSLKELLGKDNLKEKENEPDKEKALRRRLWHHFSDSLKPVSKYKNSYRPREDIDWHL